MSDKEVGELWRRYWSPDAQTADAEQIIALIRKLVEERRNYYQATWLGTVLAEGAAERSLNQALHEFGLDPAEWEKANG